ncbi:hypothetical protein DL96DRAFT_1702488 [Flagelloscypha sp. PMI_526]|nr:hypothetical protein DL96DRAFT_1702488 [Flagelloscypha sp. PMI_526]
MSAKTNKQVSNREKKSNKLRNADERKVVFKSVLDNPFRIPWPNIPLNVQNTCLASLTHIFDGLALYHRTRSSRNKSLKRETKGQRSKQPEVEMPVDQEDPIETPENLKHISFGINQTTKHLESMIKQCREPQTILETPPPALRIIFVCRQDVNPPILIDHIPHSVAAFNSSGSLNPVKLVTLPKNAEVSLAEAVGLRRVAVVGILETAPCLQELLASTESIPTLSASWLTHAFEAKKRSAELLPTHIKQLKTSAPKDLKAAKARKAEERQEDKETAETGG